MGGQIVDATVVAAPRQRHTDDEKAALKRGWSVTSAAAYDGAQLGNVPDRGNTGSKVWADSAYRSKKNEGWLDQNG